MTHERSPRDLTQFFCRTQEAVKLRARERVAAFALVCNGKMSEDAFGSKPGQGTNALCRICGQKTDPPHTGIEFDVYAHGYTGGDRRR